jgi:hypothetical protein
MTLFKNVPPYEECTGTCETCAAQGETALGPVRRFMTAQMPSLRPVPDGPWLCVEHGRQGPWGAGMIEPDDAPSREPKN